MKETTRASLGIADVLTIVFVVLKLCGLIQWSWVWVLSPLWISLTIWLIFVAIVIILWRK